MNYRHHFHAGNFADVAKHALLVLLIRALQKKEKGFLYLDTHAGRGLYDLEAAATGDSLARQPEWPAGVGRLWSGDLPPEFNEYETLIHQFDRDKGNATETPRYYPGSPWLARLLSRPQDRLALCEKHPEEFEALREEFDSSPGTSVHLMDGYQALRAMLPPREKRALVLIDPPFEAQDEWAQIVSALRDSLRRLPGGTFAVWYPLTQRARIEAFFGELLTLKLPPTLILELSIAGDLSPLKMKGCGLVIVNPPWKFDEVAEPTLTLLAQRLAQGVGSGRHVQWLVPETS